MNTSKSTFGHLKNKKTPKISYLGVIFLRIYLINASINSSFFFFEVAAKYAGVKPFLFN